MRCEEPVKIIEILRLWDQGYSQREIAASVKCGKTTVGEIQRRCQTYGLTYEKAEAMTDDAIKLMLYPDSFGKPVKPDPDWEALHKRLESHKRLNLQYIWEEYRTVSPEGLSYSQFCKRYEKWRNETGKRVVMAQNREPGRELFVDWMGDTLACVVDGATGEVFDAHFFVATLVDSGYPYVEAFPDEKLDKWLLAHVHTLERLGGVPKVIVPDNCKTAVSKPGYYDPKINPAYWDFAKHYDVAVIPARIREPRDKASVESTVGWLETWLLEWLRGKQFFGFEALNVEIRQRVDELTVRPFKRRVGSRRSVYEQVDKPALRPLPASRYEYAEYIVRRVPDNYHIDYGGFYYSVPYRLHKQNVTLRVTAQTIEIVNANRERVAIHQRRFVGSRYVTKREHMPENHRIYADSSRFDGAKYRQWAKSVGESTYAVIDGLLKAQPVEETAYRSCMGILQATKRYGPERLELACAKAIVLRSCTYTTVINILKNAQDKLPAATPSTAVPVHENIRGAASFS